MRAPSSLLWPIAAFELRQQLRSHVFWVVFAISCLMVFGSVTVERLQIGPMRQGLRNAPSAIAQVHLVWTLFHLFTATAFAADAVLRDDTTGFGPIVRSLPVRRTDYLLGRFAGAFGATLACYASVPVALVAAMQAPWLDAATLGPFEPRAYLLAFFGLAVPNLFVGAALFFSLATVTRSMMAAYLGAVALLVAYGLGAGPAGAQAASPLVALLEPFGFAALAFVTRGWSAAQRDAAVAPLAGMLLYNRLLWLAVGAACLAATYALFRMQPGARTIEPGRRGGQPGARSPGQWPDVPDSQGLPHGAGSTQWLHAPRARAEPRRSGPPGVGPAVAVRGPAAAGPPSSQPAFGPATARAQLAARTRLELRQVLGSPVFAVLILLGILNAAGAVWAASDPAGAPAPPDAQALVRRLIEAFRLVPITVALFYAGELVWNERERQVHEIVGAAPLPDWAFLAPKLLAIALVLALLALASAATAAGVQAVRGAVPVDPAAYLSGYVLPMTLDWTLVAVLAVFFQAVSPGKVAGWGWMVLYLVASMAMDGLGLRGSLYRYGGHPDLLESAATGPGGVTLAYWVRAYWAAFAVVLAVLAHALWGRGAQGGLGARLARLPQRLRGAAGAVAAAALAVFALLGGLLARHGMV